MLLFVRSNNSFDQIYSPSPFHKASLSRVENTMQQLEVRDKIKLLFLTIGEDGMMIIDQDTLDIVFEIKDKGQIDYFTVDKNGEYVYFSYLGRISMFQFIKKPNYSLQLICQDMTDRGQYVNTVFLFNDERYAAGASQDVLVIYDVSDKKNMKIIGEIQVGMNPFYIIYQITNHLFLVNMQLKIVRFQQNQDQIKLSIVFNIPADYAYSNLVITKDQKFIYALDSWAGLYIGKFIVLDDIQDGSVKEDFEFELKKWWPTNQSPLPNQINISSDENFIFVGVQQLGVYIFDISQREIQIKPKLFQWIRSPGYSFSIALSQDQKYLYYVNGIQLQIYQKVQPNLNNDYPNLFNIQQANFTVVGENMYRWRCYIMKNEEYLIGAFDKDGLFIFDLKQNPLNLIQKQQVQPENMYYTESALIDEESGYVITPGNSAGQLLFVYEINQFRQQQKIKPASQLDYADTTIVMEGIRFNYNKKYIGIAAYSSVFLVDYSHGPLNLSVLSSVSFNNEIVELVFTKDDKYILGVSRNYGLVCISIGEDLKLTQVSFLKTSGGFCVIQSQNWDYAYICEGAKGIGIVDLKQLPKIVFISRIGVEGTTMHITPIRNDQFFLVSSNVEGFLTLVDARDKLNLQVMSKFLVFEQNGLASCVNESETYAFLSNGQGITSLPISSKIQVHTEMFLVKGKETKKIVLQRQQPNQVLFVGQTFQFQFYQIYPIIGARLTNIYYYQNFDIVSLPYWIIFNYQLSSINLECVKDALGDDVSIASFNTVILEYKIPLTPKSFQFDQPVDGDGIIISEDLSKEIHKQLRIMEIINAENLITNNFQRTETFRFQNQAMNSDQAILDKVKRILQQSIYQNPVMFKMTSSLRFFNTPQEVPEYQSQNNNSSNNFSKIKYFIFSIQNSLQIYFEIQQGLGKFVEIYYDGVIAQISNFETHLKLEGTVENINHVMTKGILFFKENNINTDDININLVLKDGVNYNIEKKLKLSECSAFIKLKQPIILNQQLKLQQQFNQLFSSGQVAIQDNISFEFSKDTFINKDTNTINYKATFKQGSQYVDSVQGLWIQQSSNSLRFFGVVPIEEYRTVLHIKIEANDGYTTVSDTFNIYVYNIPFIYIFSTLIKILGPILTILGVYRYRSYFFNLAFHKKNIYRTEQISINNKYYKKITILATENIKAILFFKALLSKTSQIKTMLKQNPNLFNTINSQNTEEQAPSQQGQPSKKNQQNIFFQPKSIVENLQIDDKNINFLQIFDDAEEIASPLIFNETNNFMKIHYQQNSTIQSILENFISQLKQLEQDQKQPQILNNLNSSNNKINNIDKDIILEDEENKNIKNQQSSNETNSQNQGNYPQNNNNNNNSYKPSSIDFLSQYFLKQDGSVKMKQIIKLMIELQIQIKYQNQLITMQSIIPELTNPSSRLYQSLKAVISRYFLRQYKPLQLIYNFIKESSKLEQKHLIKCNKDWYLKYLKIIPEQNNDQSKSLSFPKIQILIDKIKDQIKLMTILLQNDQKFKLKQLSYLNKNNKIPFNLLYNVIIADCYGLVENQPSMFIPSQGESIHQNFFEINSVQAYKKVEHLQCSFLRRILKLDVMNYGSSKNQQLPSWMKFSLKSNAIIISGIPQIQDVETFIIRITDVTDYIIRQFEIEIQKPSEDAPISLERLNNLQDDEIKHDGLINPQQLTERSSARNSSFQQESFFLSFHSNQEQIISPSHLAQTPLTSKNNLNTNRQENNTLIQQVLSQEFKKKK